MEEIWKDIPNYEGYYQVSNLGNVRSLDRILEKGKHTFCSKGKQLSIVLSPHGYYNIWLYKEKKVKKHFVHRLVAQAFIPNPENKPFINHIDGHPTNNNVTNLEWCTPKENFDHAKRTGLWVYNDPYRHFRVMQFDLDGNYIATYESSADAGRKTGVCKRNILQVASKTPFNNKGAIRKQAGGFIWKFE